MWRRVNGQAASSLRSFTEPALVRSVLVSDEPGLFDVPSGPVSETLQEMPIRPGQVQQIREAFDAAGITEQGERKTLINSVIIREVASLRELRAVEVRRVLTAIKQRSVVQPTSKGSAWDNREEETWIDKL